MERLALGNHLARVIAMPRKFIWGIVLLMMHATAVPAATLDVVRPAPESPGDTRYDYYWALLNQALTITEPDFISPTASAAREGKAMSRPGRWAKIDSPHWECHIAPPVR